MSHPIWILRCALLGVALSVCSCSSNAPGNRGTLQKSVDAADETSTIQTLRTILSAQTQAKAIRGTYADFPGLVDGGFLDARFSSATPALRGYRFSMSASAGEFSINADPINPASARHFYLDSNDEAIHVNPTAAASRSDPTL
ncbi:MAG TPA: hypothetical protein VNG71_02970 [Pyrinomonadaceae bacterium]|nr:hypothetical protein [Pyrinomonadaceae bacterium]